MKRLPFLLGATALGLALTTVSCTTLGTHVKGGFACHAPQGTCAPMSNIDAQAIAGLGAGGSDSTAISADDRERPARFMTTGLPAGEPVRTGENVMRVVFPAHTDPSGVFHEQAVAHVVSGRSSWTLRPTDAPAPGSLDAAIAAAVAKPHDQPASAAEFESSEAVSTTPLTLREAAAGLSAAATPQPEEIAEQVAVDVPAGTAGAPTAEALAAARAGHHIGDGAPIIASQSASRRPDSRNRSRHRSSGRVAATVPGAATAALNRAVLHRLTLSSRAGPSGTVVVASHDAADAARRLREVASAAAAPTTDQAAPQ